MFDQALQSEEWKEKRDREGRSEDEVASLRLAAWIIAINAVLSAGITILLTGQPPPLLGVIIGLLLARYLYKLRPRAENLALGLAILALVVFPALWFWRLPFLDALIQTIGNCGVSGSLLLLLLGEQRRARRIAATAVFAAVAGGYYLLALVGHFVGAS